MKRHLLCADPISSIGWDVASACWLGTDLAGQACVTGEADMFSHLNLLPDQLALLFLFSPSHPWTARVFCSDNALTSVSETRHTFSCPHVRGLL